MCNTYQNEAVLIQIWRLSVSYTHSLLGFELWQVQVPVFITDDPLLIFLQLLLGLRVQASLHELSRGEKSN